MIIIAGLPLATVTRQIRIINYTMKKIVFSCCILLFLTLSSSISLAQTYYVYVTSSEGKRFGKYNVTDDFISTVTDTISVKDARNIVSVNSVRGSKLATEQGYVLVQAFSLTVEEKKASTTYTSMNDLLTPEMRKHIMNINSGTILYFKDIAIKSYESSVDVPVQSITYVIK